MLLTKEQKFDINIDVNFIINIKIKNLELKSIRTKVEYIEKIEITKLY